MARKFRILHVIDHLGTGGAQEILLNLVKYADRRRFQVEVAALHGCGHYWEACRRLGTPVYSLSPHKLLPLYVPKLFSLFRKGRYDLAHCHLIAANLIAKPLAALAGVPVRFNHDHTNDIYRYRKKARLWLDRLANRLTQQIIAVSASTRDFLLQWEKLPVEKVSLIYNGVDLEHFAPEAGVAPREAARARWGLPEAAPVVGGVGRLRFQKNFPLFLEVAAEIVKIVPEARFVIAGDGPEQPQLERLARELGIAGQVHFLGFVADIRELYPALDVLLVPSHFEGTPLTVLEAMAMGVPLVASRVDGIAEVLEDGMDAFLAPPGDRGRFTACVLRLLQDRATAGRLVRAAREKVRAGYSAEAMVRRVESLYLKYLEPGEG